MRQGGFVAVVIAALVLAGCVQSDAGPDDATTPAAAAGGVAANVSADMDRPDGREGGFAAFNETNRTEAGVGGLDHDHDLWAGRERVTIFEGAAAMTACCFTTTPRAYVRLATPPEALVFEGTGAVEVTLSDPSRRACSNLYLNGERVCTDYESGQRVADPTGASGVHLFVRDAAKKDFQDLGEVAWGKPMSFPIKDARQTDMPHSLYSLWAFEVRSADAKDDTLFFDAKIDIVRAVGAEIPRWPGHPEFYAESSSREVLRASGKTRENGPMTYVDPAGDSLPFVEAQKLVSYGTRTLYVWVNITDVKVDNPALAPSGWDLHWHNASQRVRAVSSEATGGEAKAHAWVLPVDDNGMDSPYGEASRWGFRLMAYVEAGAAGTPVLGCFGLCAMYEVSYDVVVLASNEVLAEDAYSVKPS